MNKLKYYVLLPNGNDKYYNIFNNGGFRSDLMNLKAKTRKDKKLNLSDEIRRVLSYTFRGRFEYEMMIRAPFEKDNYKIDVYDQVMLNFDMFCTYIIANWRCIPAKTYRQQENEIKRKEIKE